VAALRVREGLDFVVDQAVDFKQAEQLPPVPMPPSYMSEPVTLQSYFDVEGFGTNMPLFRRKALVCMGAWDEELPCGQDMEFFGRVLARGLRAAYVPDGLAYQRIHDGQLSRRMSLEELRRGHLLSAEKLVRHVIRNGQVVPVGLRRNRLLYRFHLRAMHGDAVGALDDLRGLSPLFTPQERVFRLKLWVRYLILRLAGVRAYTFIFDTYRRLKRLTV